MTILLINNKTICKSLNTFLQSLLKIQSKNRIISLTFTLPNYTSLEIAEAYIQNEGCIQYLDNDTMYNKDKRIMMAVFLKYPHRVKLKDDDLSDNQIIDMIYSQESYVPLLQKIKLCYNESNIKDYENDNIKYQAFNKHYKKYDVSLQKIIHIVFKRHSYKDILYSNNVINTSKNVISHLLKRQTSKYIKFMFDYENDNVIRLDHKYIYVNKNIIQYTRHPYNYTSNKTIITDRNSLFEELQHNMKNIYINGDVIVNKGDEIVNLLNRMNPKDFESWSLGPKCKKIVGLFQNYDITYFKNDRKYNYGSNITPHSLNLSEDINIEKYNSESYKSIKVKDISEQLIPNIKDNTKQSHLSTSTNKLYTSFINHLNVEHLENCDCLFAESNITDLSNMNFYSCKYANSMFDKCYSLTKAPLFYNLVECKWMFADTNITDIDKCIVNTENIEDLYGAFFNTKCKILLNNRLFNKLEYILFDSIVHGNYIRKIFNNCTFRNLKCIETEEHDEIISVRMMFNSCKFNCFDSVEIVNKNPNSKLKWLFNNCCNINGKECRYNDMFNLYLEYNVCMLNNTNVIKYCM